MQKWAWRNSAVRSKIATHWTRLATECYLQKSCVECIFWQYCDRYRNGGIPTMRLVVNELYRKFGEPPQEIIDKVLNGDYN